MMVIIKCFQQLTDIWNVSQGVTSQNRQNSLIYSSHLFIMCFFNMLSNKWGEWINILFWNIMEQEYKLVYNW